MSTDILARALASSGGGKRVSQPGSEPEGAPILDAYSQAVIEVAERLRPAVVNVSVWGRRHSPWEDPPSGNGSGIVIAPDGLVVTNYHVVENTRKVELTFSDGEEAEWASW
jgi:S1-C subfamily serine protease